MMYIQKCIAIAVFLSVLVNLTNELGYQCCGMFQMDAKGVVLVEGSRPLAMGEYQAARFRSCNTKQFAIQLWDCLANFSSCTLKWQTTVSPTVGDSVVVNFNQAVNVDTGYRLGLYAPYSSDQTLSVPFGIDSSLAFMFESNETFRAFDQLSLQSTINLKSPSWTRSFAKSLIFCKNPDCTDVPPSSLASITPVSENPQQPPFGQCCGNSTCDLEGMRTDVLRNEMLINTLKKTVDELEEVVNKLRPGEPPPPRCPQNFVPGEYGLGSCYLVVRENLSMAEAALTCRDSSESTLVQINSEAENRFLAGLSVSNAGTAVSQESFWMAAMYEIPLRDWFWYDTNLETKYPISYSKWQDGQKPVVSNRDESCSNFVAKPDTSYWVKEQCKSRKYFICEVPKECD